MNIQELLAQVPVEHILKVLAKRYTLDEEKQLRFEDTHRRIIRQLLAMNSVPGPYLMVGDIYEYDGDSHLAVSLYLKDQLEKELHACNQLGQMHGQSLSISKMEEVLDQNKLPESYSTLFVPWAEIAGCTVSPINVARCGQAEFLAAVLYEITFYGFDEETIAKEQAELDDALTEAESDQTTRPIEEVWKELGIEWHEKTETEANAEREERVKSLFHGCLRTYAVLWEIVNAER